LSLFVESFPVGPLQCNCSIVACEETKDAIVIDPGGDVDKIIDLLNKRGYTARYLLHTHAHFDHIIGSRAMREKTGAKICLHEKDKFLYDNLKQQVAMFGFKADDPLPADHYLSDEEEVTVGLHKATVLFTPGHTPGSCCFNVGDKESVLFAGDTLFHRSIGRTDLWGGSFDDIKKSIQTRLFALDDSTRVVTGHGEDTDIWSEKRENPFVGS
jgi:glyoxylase-like metal-dependent hydrolase (beta-lactamase superfamily II)